MSFRFMNWWMLIAGGVFMDYSWALLQNEAYYYSVFKRANERAKRKIARLGYSYPQIQKDITKIYLEIQKAVIRGNLTLIGNYVTEKFEKKMAKPSLRNRMNMYQNVELLSVQAVSFKKRRFFRSFEKMRVRIEGKCSRSDDLEPEFFALYYVFIRNNQEGWKLRSVRRPYYLDRSIYSSGRYG